MVKKYKYNTIKLIFDNYNYHDLMLRLLQHDTQREREIEIGSKTSNGEKATPKIYI